jgi:hypothetical protein
MRKFDDDDDDDGKWRMNNATYAKIMIKHEMKI